VCVCVCVCANVNTLPYLKKVVEKHAVPVQHGEVKRAEVHVETKAAAGSG
jgi:hypothetical protein